MKIGGFPEKCSACNAYNILYFSCVGAKRMDVWEKYLKQAFAEHMPEHDGGK